MRGPGVLVLLIGLLAGDALGAGADVPLGGTAEANAVFQHPATPQQLESVLGPATQELRRAAALHGDFHQRKFLHELPQPLLSSGSFVVARGLGIDWHTLQPFDSELVLTPQAMVQHDAGAPEHRVAASEQPGLGAVAEAFDALFALDLPRLAERFDTYGVRSGDGWTLGLKPRDSALAQHIPAVIIAGTTQPQQIVLYEAGGDRTEISFSRQTASAALGDGERQRFK